MITRIAPWNMNNSNYIKSNCTPQPQSTPSFGNTYPIDKFIKRTVPLQEGLSRISNVIKNGVSIALDEKTDPYGNLHNLSLRVVHNPKTDRLTLKLDYINPDETGSIPLYTDKFDQFAENINKKQTINEIEDTIRENSLRFEDEPKVV